MKRVIVTGAASRLSIFLLPRLILSGYHVYAFSRRQENIRNIGSAIQCRIGFRPNKNQLSWHQLSENSVLFFEEIRGIQNLVHIAPLWVLPQFMKSLKYSNLSRVIALSSTSRYSKISSKNAEERLLATRLVDAEHDLIDYCLRANINWTIFRPTMIYGSSLDTNIMLISDFIRRFGFFPLLGSAKGLRQPVHFDDIAETCVSVMDKPTSFSKAYNLSGGETLTFFEMVKRIFVSLGRKPRIISIPITVFDMCTSLAGLIPANKSLNMEMIRRMNDDLCFNHAKAHHDFGYCPRPFVLD